MRLFFCLLLFLLVTPLRFQLDLQLTHSVRFRLRIFIWGIPLVIDHSQEARPLPPPSPSGARQSMQLLHLSPHLRRPLQFLLRRTEWQTFQAQVLLSLRNPASGAVLCAFLQQLSSFVAHKITRCARICVLPDICRDESLLALRCIIFLHLGTLVIAAVMVLAAWKETQAWNIPSAS